MKMRLKNILRIVMLIFILLPAIIIAIVGVVSASSFSSAMMLEETGVMSFSQVSGINALFSEYSSTASAISKTMEVELSAKGQYTEVSESLDSLFASALSADDTLVDIAVMDTGGCIVKDLSGTQQGTVFFGFNDEMQTIGKTESYISDIYADNITYGKSVFVISRTVRSGENTIGYLALVVSTDRIASFLGKTEFFDNGQLVVFDRKGTTVNLNGSELTRCDEISDGSIKEKINSIIAANKIMDSKESFEAGGNYGNYGNIKNTGWFWAGLYPMDNVKALISGSLNVGMIILALVCSACVVFMFVNSSLLLNPMTNMINKMNSIKKGNRTERLNIAGKNDFAQMAEVFNNMLSDAMISEELHRTISDISDNMLFEWDFKTNSLYVSDNLQKKFDIIPAKATGLDGNFIEKCMTPESAERYLYDIEQLYKTKVTMAGEYQATTIGGNEIWISLRAQCMCDRFGSMLRVIGVITDIDAEKKLTLQLVERASYDFLSQLYNRSTFERELQSELERHANSRVGIMFIDVDDFKMINDRYGHSVGDEVIKYVSDKINYMISGGGFAGRFGGDEFVLCITDSALLDKIDVLSLDLIEELHSGYHSDTANVTLNIKASIGVAISPEHGNSYKSLIAAADEAMYFVKKNGKSNYHIYNPDDSKAADLEHTV